jgi:hypothetical protein
LLDARLNRLVMLNVLVELLQCGPAGRTKTLIDSDS